MTLVNLQKARLTQGLTQEAVAKQLGITKQAYNRIELSKRETCPKIWDKLEDIFEINQRVLRKEKEDIFMPLPSKKLYDVDEFRAEILNNKVSKSTIYAKIKSGEIKAIKIGRKPLIPAWFVEELLTSHNI